MKKFGNRQHSHRLYPEDFNLVYFPYYFTLAFDSKFRLLRYCTVSDSGLLRCRDQSQAVEKENRK